MARGDKYDTDWLDDVESADPPLTPLGAIGLLLLYTLSTALVGVVAAAFLGYIKQRVFG